MVLFRAIGGPRTFTFTNGGITCVHEFSGTAQEVLHEKCVKYLRKQSNLFEEVV